MLDEIELEDDLHEIGIDLVHLGDLLADVHLREQFAILASAKHTQNLQQFVQFVFYAEAELHDLQAFLGKLLLHAALAICFLDRVVAGKLEPAHGTRIVVLLKPWLAAAFVKHMLTR